MLFCSAKARSPSVSERMALCSSKRLDTWESENSDLQNPVSHEATVSFLSPGVVAPETWPVNASVTGSHPRLCRYRHRSHTTFCPTAVPPRFTMGNLSSAPIRRPPDLFAAAAASKPVAKCSYIGLVVFNISSSALRKCFLGRTLFLRFLSSGAPSP